VHRAAPSPALGRKAAQSGAKLAHYVESATMLDDRTPEHPMVRQLRSELKALQSLPSES